MCNIQYYIGTYSLVIIVLLQRAVRNMKSAKREEICCLIILI